MELPGEVEVSVTADDIGKGEAGNCAHCPIALAASRAINKLDTSRVWLVEVFNTSVLVSVSPEYRATAYRYRLPMGASQFILDFDRFKPVEPFKFVMVRE